MSQNSPQRLHEEALRKFSRELNFDGTHFGVEKLRKDLVQAQGDIVSLNIGLSQRVKELERKTRDLQYALWILVCVIGALAWQLT